MNIRAISINLAKSFHKFFIFNTMMFIGAFLLLFFLMDYQRKDLLITISLVFTGIIVINFFVTKFIQNKMNKLIKHSFEKVEAQLYFDELTSVYNRKTGLNRLNEELLRAKRTGKPLSIAILDIDDFKRINDKYGHLVGDRVLNYVALQIKNALRLCDVVARYGGEEFLIILPETDEIKALSALERVRKQISKKPIKIGNERVYITVSIGLTEVEFIENPFEAIHKADLALYQAKRDGKNKIEIFLKLTKSRN